jgi:hypothetical protein
VLSRAESAIYFRVSGEHAMGMLTLGSEQGHAAVACCWPDRAADGHLHPSSSTCMPELARLTRRLPP